MTLRSQHLRFSVELSFKAGHEAIIAHIEGEIKHLEHVKEYLIKRAKVELEYASSLARISAAAAKAINDSDRDSPIRKVQFYSLYIENASFLKRRRVYLSSEIIRFSVLVDLNAISD